MPHKEENYIHSLFLESFYFASAVFFIWLWTNNHVLANYNLQLTAFLVVIYFAGRFFFGKKNLSFVFDCLVFASVLLLVLSSTGGLASPLFFLVYFLLFATALLFDALTTLTLTLLLVLFFAKSLNSLHSALQLLSLVFISPLALFFGNRYLRLLETQEKVKILARKSKQLSVTNYQQSTNIANEETSSLIWLTLDFKNSLLKIIHHSSDLLTDIGRLTLSQKEKLQSIHEAAKEILKSGEKLKDKIDRETD